MKTRPCRPTPLTKIQDQKEQLDLDARNSSSYFLCWICIWTLGVFVVYFKTMHPSIPGGDSGELIAVGSVFPYSFLVLFFSVVFSVDTFRFLRYSLQRMHSELPIHPDIRSFACWEGCLLLCCRPLLASTKFFQIICC